MIALEQFLDFYYSSRCFTLSQTDPHLWMFPHGDVEHWLLWREKSKLICLVTYFLNSTFIKLRKKGIFFFASLTIYYHIYLQQFGKYLEVDLIGSKATNQNREKISFNLSCLMWGLKPGPFSSEFSAFPSHLFHLF